LVQISYSRFAEALGTAKWQACILVRPRDSNGLKAAAREGPASRGTRAKP
jgi:hypothetical protein